MTASTGIVVLADGVRRPIASAHTAVAVLKNIGSAPARIVTEPFHPDNGRVVAPGATLEVEPRGWTIYAVADSVTTLEVASSTVAALRKDAADEFNVPVELIRGRTKAEIGDSIVRFLGHEARPDITQEGTAA